MDSLSSLCASDKEHFISGLNLFAGTDLTLFYILALHNNSLIESISKEFFRLLGEKQQESEFLLKFNLMISSSPIRIQKAFAKNSHDFICSLLYHLSLQIQQQAQQFLLDFIKQKEHENTCSLIIFNLLDSVSYFSDNFETLLQSSEEFTFLFIPIIESFSKNQTYFQIILNKQEQLFSLLLTVIRSHHSNKKQVSKYFSFLIDSFFNHDFQIILHFQIIQNFWKIFKDLLKSHNFKKFQLEKCFPSFSFYQKLILTLLFHLKVFQLLSLSSSSQCIL
jgi:hypothetical protein